MISHERLLEVLRWDGRERRFFWRISIAQRKAGSLAGSYDADGYRHITIDKKNYFEHRLSWFYAKGEWPRGQVDHINCIRDDNRIENLRDVDPKTNRQNMRKPTAKNKSGFLGVSPLREGGWAAFITIDGKQKRLGAFSSPELASAAYVSAKRRLHEGCTI